MFMRINFLRRSSCAKRPPDDIREPPARHPMRLYGAIIMAFLVALVAAPVNAQPIKIVAFGDSLIAGFGLKANESFPAQLETALRKKGHNVEIVNAGVSGDTTSGGLSRLDWSVQDGTDAVIVVLGANDMLRGMEPEIARKNLEQIVSRLKARKIEVILGGMRAAPNLGADYAKKFDSIYADLAKEHDISLYPFFLDGVAGQRDLNLSDGIHPTPKGVSLVVERILPTVESLIERVKKHRG
jgi:acyl-CoA thioesterase-1